MFDKNCIGRGGTSPWPPRSSDLTLDFFLWGHVKDVVYRTPPMTLCDLQRRITVPCANILPATLLSVHRNTVNRAQLCLAADRMHFKQLL